MKYLKRYDESLFKRLFKSSPSIPINEFARNVKDILLDITDEGFTVQFMKRTRTNQFNRLELQIYKRLKTDQAYEDDFRIKDISEVLLRLFDYSKIVNIKGLSLECSYGIGVTEESKKISSKEYFEKYINSIYKLVDGVKIYFYIG